MASFSFSSLTTFIFSPLEAFAAKLEAFTRSVGALALVEEALKTALPSPPADTSSFLSRYSGLIGGTISLFSSSNILECCSVSSFTFTGASINLVALCPRKPIESSLVSRSFAAFYLSNPYSPSFSLSSLASTNPKPSCFLELICSDLSIQSQYMSTSLVSGPILC